MAITVKNLGLKISLFADDAVIYCSNYDQYFVQIRIERALRQITDWCTKNCININIDKKKFCIYGTKTRVDTFENNTIGEQGKQISRCHQYYYWMHA